MNQPLRATFTRTDQDRNCRLMLAWIAEDKAAFDLVLDEAMAEPAGVPGLLFALVEFTTRLGLQVEPDTFVLNLQARLAHGQLEHDDSDG
jgi:hypothetical protein